MEGARRERRGRPGRERPARAHRLRRLTGVPLAVAFVFALTAGSSAGTPTHPDGFGGRAAMPSAVVPGSVNRTSIEVEARYDVRLTLRLATRSLAGGETVTFVNRSGGPIDRLELNTVLARLGGLRISAATVDGKRVLPRIVDQTILLPLGGILANGAAATARITFTARFGTRLDGSRWLFTAAGGTFAAYRWLPWVSRARPFDRPNYGDPFVTASSPFVRLTVLSDRAVRIATNGRRTLVAAGGRQQVFEAANVRDLGFVADPAFAVATARVGSTRVQVYARTAAARARLLGAATRALARLESVLGPYAWPVLTVAETAGGYGVELPGAIWIPGGVPAANLPWLVTHEVAHQWFYGVVGNDQAMQPFADEAVADFLARYVTGSFRVSQCRTTALDGSIYSYSAACYFEIVYVQGGRLIEDVRRRVGSAALFGALRGYVASYRFGFGSTRALIAALDAVDPRNLAAAWKSRFPHVLG